MSEDFLLDLSTEVVPPKKFKVDGIDYTLKGPDHLSPSEDARVQALFSRHNQLQDALEREPDVRRGQLIAQQARKARTAILCALSTMPDEVADALPTGAQVKLLEAIQTELERAVEESGETKSTTVTSGARTDALLDADAVS